MKPTDGLWRVFLNWDGTCKVVSQPVLPDGNLGEPTTIAKVYGDGDEIEANALLFAAARSGVTVAVNAYQQILALPDPACIRRLDAVLVCLQHYISWATGMGLEEVRETYGPRPTMAA